MKPILLVFIALVGLAVGDAKPGSNCSNGGSKTCEHNGGHVVSEKKPHVDHERGRLTLLFRLYS